MNIYFETYNYYVEGDYHPAVPAKDYGHTSHDGEPAWFQPTFVQLQDCDEDGRPMVQDVTRAMSGNEAFCDACLEHYESYYV